MKEGYFYDITNIMDQANDGIASKKIYHMKN